jgi:hypothetical protein
MRVRPSKMTMRSMVILLLSFQIVNAKCQDSIAKTNLREVDQLKQFYREICADAKSPNVVKRKTIRVDNSKIELMNRFYKIKDSSVSLILSLFDSKHNSISRWREDGLEYISVTDDFPEGNLRYYLDLKCLNGRIHSGTLKIDLRNKLFCELPGQKGQGYYYIVFDYIYFEKFLLSKTEFPLRICNSCPESTTQLTDKID